MSPIAANWSRQRAVGRGRRIVLHQLSGPAEVGLPVQRIDLLDRDELRLQRDVPALLRRHGIENRRDHRERILPLDGGDVRHVLLAVDQRAADYPDQRRRGVDAFRSGRRFALPAWTGDQILSGAASGRAQADVAEDVGVGVLQHQRIVAPAGVRHGDQRRALLQIEEGAGIDRVGVGGDDVLVGRGDQLADMAEAVERRVSVRQRLVGARRDLRGRRGDRQRIGPDISLDAAGEREVLLRLFDVRRRALGLRKGRASDGGDGKQGQWPDNSHVHSNAVTTGGFPILFCTRSSAPYPRSEVRIDRLRSVGKHPSSFSATKSQRPARATPAYPPTCAIRGRDLQR